MLSYLPEYWAGEPLFVRIIQAEANEIDRIDELFDWIEQSLQPGSAEDPILGEWEAILGLPVRPAGVSVEQRQAKCAAAIQTLDAGSSERVLEALEAALGVEGFEVTRDEPDVLKDTITIPYASGGYTARQVELLVRRMWPSHRGLFMSYTDGFLLDISRLDIDTF